MCNSYGYIYIYNIYLIYQNHSSISIQVERNIIYHCENELRCLTSRSGTLKK